MQKTVNPDFRLNKVDETRNYFIEETKQRNLMSRKAQKMDNIKQLVILLSAITECVSTSSFTSLVGIPVDIPSSALRLKICAITSGIEQYKSIIRRS